MCVVQLNGEDIAKDIPEYITNVTTKTRRSPGTRSGCGVAETVVG